MKVLLIGTEFFGYCDSLKENLQKLGNEVYVYHLKSEWRKTFEGKVYEKCHKIYWKLKGYNEVVGIHPPKAKAAESQNAYDMYQSIKPDVVINFGCYMLSKEVVKQMEAAYKVLWVYDGFERLIKIHDTFKYYDDVYTFERDDIPKFKKIGINAKFLPLCADENVYYPIDTDCRQIDLCFVGALIQERVEMFRKVHKMFPNITMQIYGHYVSRYNIIERIRRRRRHEETYLINRNIKPAEVNELYSKSKININLQRSQSKYGANIRLFEILATNSFQLVNSNAYVEDCFSDCLDTFKSDEEMFDKIKYYLEHRNEREYKASKGYNKVVKEDLFINRARAIMDNIQMT